MKHLIRSIRLRLSYLKLKPKFALICILSAFVPFIVFVFMLNILFRNFNITNNLHTLQSSFTLAETTISNQTEMVKRSMSLLLGDPNLRELVQEHPYNYDYDVQHDYKLNADSVLEYVEKEDYVDSLRIYIPNSYSYLLDYRNYFPVYLIDQKNWYNSLANTNGKSLWLYERSEDGTSTEFISYVTKALDPNNYHRYTSTIKIDLDLTKLAALLDSAITVSGSNFYILDENGNCILSDSSGTPCLYQDFSPYTSNQWEIHSVDRSTYYTYQAPLYGCDWYLVCVIPKEALCNLPILQSYGIYLGILMLSSILIFILSFRFTSSFTRRITNLAEIMGQVQDKKDLVEASPSHIHDEIDTLTTSYNYMVKVMNTMMEREYLSGVSQRNAEFRALRAQINPHFLYNTLEIINYYAEEQNAETVDDLIANLATFYKISLSSGQDFYQISQELALLDAYISIINIRYQNIIRLVCDIPSEFYECEIPKITLQPLVENAVVHGILEKEERRGTITLHAEQVGRNVVISVEDDGKGMDAETVRKLNSNLLVSHNQNAQNHYGISNINDRLHQVYGDQFQLTFSSTPGKGTTVFFIIPRHRSS